MRLKTTLALPLNFWVFAIGRLLVYAGSIFSTICIPILTLTNSNSVFHSSLTTSAVTVPYLIFGLLAGALVDQGHTKKILLLSIFAPAIAVSTIPLYSFFGQIGLLHALTIAFISGTSFVWFDAACFGILPQLVSTEQLPQANSFLWTTGSLIEITLPALVAVTIKKLSPELALSGEPILLLIAAVTLIKTKTRLNSNINIERKNRTNDITAGIRFILQTKYIRELTIIGTLSAISNGAIVGLLAAILKAWETNFLTNRVITPWTSIAVGALLAAIILPTLAKHFHFGYITITALFSYPIILFLLAANYTSKLGVVLLGRVAKIVVDCFGVSFRHGKRP